MLLLTACRRMAVADGRTPWGVLARAEGGGEELLGLEKLSTGALSFLYPFIIPFIIPFRRF